MSSALDLGLVSAVERWAGRAPDRPAVGMIGEEPLTFGALAEDVRAVASGIAGLGVRRGDTVLVMLPNGLDFVRCWLAISSLGAIQVPINVHDRGGFPRPRRPRLEGRGCDRRRRVGPTVRGGGRRCRAATGRRRGRGRGARAPVVAREPPVRRAARTRRRRPACRARARRRGERSSTPPARPGRPRGSCSRTRRRRSAPGT